MDILGIVLILSVACIIFSLFQFSSVTKKSAGSKQMQHISQLIYDGAMQFLQREYYVLIIILSLIGIGLSFLDYRLSIAFVMGSLLSLIAGNISMRVATKANARTAEASRHSLEEAFNVAFTTGMAGSVFSLSLGMIGIIVIYWLYGVQPLFLFGLGASFVALFMRVGGGIFTKSADIGADLSGKVEAGIPEDDPRNPAVVADLVGDNVGDIAGMGSDLFESFVGSIIAVMAITGAFTGSIELPLILSIVGIIASLFALPFTKGKKLHQALFRGFIVNAFIVVIVAYFISPREIFYAILTGLVTGMLIGINTNYYTAMNSKPVRKIAEAAQKGAALNVVSGLANGMASSILPVILVSAAIIVSFQLAGMYGIAISAVGMLSILGITLASDIYGSVSDNAAGIAEFCNLKDARTRAEKLDELGNTTAAIGKGFAVSSAALTALALLATYIIQAKITAIDITKAENIAALFIGTILPLLFSAYTMGAVSKGAQKLIGEVRRQFKDKKVLLGKKDPDYRKCIDITTASALRSMAVPSIAAIVIPLLVGIILGREALGSFLIGSIATSFLFGVLMANAGASMDNAKKYIEAGNLGGKQSETHKAAVIGDTVGDPLKDTAGPSLNILIKLMAIASLVFVSVM